MHKKINNDNTAVRKQNTLTLILNIVAESDFSDTSYNSTYVSHAQSLIAKVFYNNFSTKIFYEKNNINNINIIFSGKGKKTCFDNFAS